MLAMIRRMDIYRLETTLDDLSSWWERNEFQPTTLPASKEEPWYSDSLTTEEWNNLFDLLQTPSEGSSGRRRKEMAGNIFQGESS